MGRKGRQYSQGSYGQDPYGQGQYYQGQYGQGQYGQGQHYQGGGYPQGGRNDRGFVDLERLNRKLIPYNIIIVLVAIACVITLMIGTAWSVSLSIDITGDMIEDMIGGALEGSPEGGESGEGAGMPEIDLSSLSRMEPIKLEIKLTAKVLLNAFQADARGATEEMVMSVIDSLLPQVNTIFKNIIKVVAGSVMTTAVNDALGDAKKEMDTANLDGIDNIIDELFEENPNIDRVKSELQGILEREINKAELTAEEKAEAIAGMKDGIDESIDSLIEEYGNEDGKISASTVLYVFVSEVGGIETEEGWTAEDLEERLSQEVAAALTKNMDENMLDTIQMGLRGLAVLMILVPAAAWALLAIFATTRIFRKNKGAYLGLAQGVGWIPFTIFVLLPTLAVKVLPDVMGRLGGETGGMEMMDMVSIKFMSMSIVSFLGTVVLFFLRIFGYRKIKKQIKRAR